MKKRMIVFSSILIVLAISVPQIYAIEDGIFYDENIIAGRSHVLTIPTHSFSIPEGFEIDKIKTSCDCLLSVWDRSSSPNDCLKLNYMAPSFSGSYKYEIIITSKNRDASINRVSIPINIKVIDAIAVSPASLDIVLDGQNKDHYLELIANDKKDFCIKKIDTDSSAITVSYPNEFGTRHKLRVKLSSSEELRLDNGKLKVITDCRQIIIPYRFIAQRQPSPTQLVFVDVVPGEKYTKQLQISNTEKSSNKIKHYASKSGFFDISQQHSGQLSVELRISPSEKRHFWTDILELTLESGEEFPVPCYVWTQKQIPPNDHLDEQNSPPETKNLPHIIPGNALSVKSECEPIHLSSKSIHLPYMRQGKVYQFRETVTNQGNESYQLNIRTGCSSCSTVKLTPNDISPGETAELSFSIFKAEPGDFALTLWIYEENQKIAPQKLIFSGYVVEEYFMSTHWQSSPEYNQKTIITPQNHLPKDMSPIFLNISISGKNRFDSASIEDKIEIISQYFELVEYRLKPSAEGYLIADLILKLRVLPIATTKEYIDWIGINLGENIKLSKRISFSL